MEEFYDTIASTISGELSRNPDDIHYYSTDGGVFEIAPSAIVFPRDVTDVQTLVRSVNDLRNSKGIETSLTARGNGTDQGGGPINTGIIVDFMQHMNQILEEGDDYVVVQPGCIYERLQNELRQYGRYIPSYPASVAVSTIGGAVANNAAGEKTVKYGATRDYVESLQVVFADGSARWIYDMNESELEYKKNFSGHEASIYQNIDTLLNDNYEAIRDNHPDVSKESSGYALWKAKQDGLFKLPQIVVGSQGTLCMITAIRMRTIPVPDAHKTPLLVSFYDNVSSMSEAAKQIHDLGPSALEIVDDNLLRFVLEHDPALLNGLLPAGRLPRFVLLAEFDDLDDEVREGHVSSAQSICSQFATSSVLKNDPVEKNQLWKLRRSAAAVMWTIPGNLKALPIIEDGTVPPQRLSEFIEKSYELFSKYDLRVAIWGHAGDANLHMQPFMDISSKVDRDKIFKVADEFYAMVHALGGTPAGEHNDSLMRAPYRAIMFGEHIERLFDETKLIFDPNNIFNPHKKVGVDFNYIKQRLRTEYSIKSLQKMNSKKATQIIDR